MNRAIKSTFLIVILISSLTGCAAVTSSNPAKSKNRITAAVNSNSYFSGIDEPAGEKVIDNQMPDICKCYEGSLVEAKIEGDLVYRLTVYNDGNVGKMDILHSTINHAHMEACIGAILSNCTFPGPISDEAFVDVKLSFSLKGNKV